MRKLRPFLHLPRLVKHERRGDEHDAKSNRGVSSPVFRVREPPAVRGPHLRRVERSSRRRTASSHFLTSSESSSSVCLRMIKVRTHRLRFLPRKRRLETRSESSDFYRANFSRHRPKENEPFKRRRRKYIRRRRTRK